MDAEDYGGGGDDYDGIGLAEDDPEGDPADEETYVHGIADVAVKTNYNQILRRRDGRGCAVACAAEAPDAAECDGEAEDGGDGEEPAPGGGGRVCAEA